MSGARGPARRPSGSARTAHTGTAVSPATAHAHSTNARRRGSWHGAGPRPRRADGETAVPIIRGRHVFVSRNLQQRENRATLIHKVHNSCTTGAHASNTYTHGMLGIVSRHRIQRAWGIGRALTRILTHTSARPFTHHRRCTRRYCALHRTPRHPRHRESSGRPGVPIRAAPARP